MTLTDLDTTLNPDDCESAPATPGHRRSTRRAAAWLSPIGLGSGIAHRTRAAFGRGTRIDALALVLVTVLILLSLIGILFQPFDPYKAIPTDALMVTFSEPMTPDGTSCRAYSPERVRH